MPADNAVNAEAAGFECHPRLEVADVLYGLLDLVLEESGERPVGKPQFPAGKVNRDVRLQQPVVQPASQKRHCLGAAYHAVEFVAVEHEESFAVGVDVDGFPDHLDVSQAIPQ